MFASISNVFMEHRYIYEGHRVQLKQILNNQILGFTSDVYDIALTGVAPHQPVQIKNYCHPNRFKLRTAQNV